MLAWETIDRSLAPDGRELVLARRGAEWQVRAAGLVLMVSHAHGSEEVMSEYALERVKAPRAVLVGGLGLGFSLRATLDKVGSHAKVTIAELVPELVEWNRAHVGHLAGHPLDDPRTVLRVGDVYDRIAESRAGFDAILLDVDNGPSALAHTKNNRLYSPTGVRRCGDALSPGGVLAVWSAGPDERYTATLKGAGFNVEVKTVGNHKGAGARHVLFLATKAGGAPSTARPREPRKSRR
jgi:spermidine synthase